MNTNRSIAVRPSATTPATKPQQHVVRVSLYGITLTLVVLLAATVGAWFFATATQPVVYGTRSIVSTGQLTQDAYVQTLPKQIQDQVARRVQPPLAASYVGYEAYILTLPKQIQAQVAGRTNATEAVSRARSEAYILTLPAQIQADVRRALATGAM